MVLQIHEPDSTPVSNSLAVGIDLGTTNSLIAWVNAQGVIESLITNDIVPSCVGYTSDKTVVGQQTAPLDPTVVIHSVKRLMGKTVSDEHTGLFPFAADQEMNKMPRLQTPQGIVTPIEVSTAILTYLKDRAEQQLGQTLDKAVITVPAYFDEAAKIATKQAAQLAGFDVLRLLNEPTAAALAYGLNHMCEGLYIVYDLGGGTFDVSLLNLTQGVFQVIATKGDNHLGGDDIDQCIIDQWRQERQQQGITEQWTLADYQDVRRVAVQLKHALSQKEAAEVSLMINGITSRHSVIREQFNQQICPLVNRTIDILKDIMLEKPPEKTIKGIILVGGTTKIPFIQETIQNNFACPIFTNIDPDRVVAWGAALQAQALTQGAETLLLDIVPLSLGLETMGGLVERIIPRGTPIPALKTQQFTTFADFQQGILLNIVQGERELATDCRSLAQFEIKNIPALPAGKARLEITFAVDADGLLTIRAVEKETGQTQTIDVQPLYGLSEGDIQRILLQSLDYQQSDQYQRHQIEQNLKMGKYVKEGKKR